MLIEVDVEELVDEVLELVEVVVGIEEPVILGFIAKVLIVHEVKAARLFHCIVVEAGVTIAPLCD